ncbi:hypothetical protein F4561_006180 [Lipingzhangella halophila]|uniref:Uncharacterized protein n=1 Tax=Lipingzhangella halophila TaxID=1783352 RepID=A0A7W7RNM2_9ACTN|nr:hypothetical protein [Lipingzhangella halophila]MBB4935286.1 hypothetical protein [Lipingzhangella halophila]
MSIPHHSEPDHTPGQPSPHPPPTQDTPQGWLDVGTARRGIWGCGVLAIVGGLLMALLTAVASVGSEDAIEGMVFAGLLVVAAVVGTIVLVTRLPRALSQQGIAVDGSGISLVQRPKWWFRGRTLHVSWGEVRSTGTLPVGEDSAQAMPNLRQFVITLYREPSAANPPTWAKLVPADEQGPYNTPPVEFPRVFVPGEVGSLNQVLEPIAAIRPDLLAEPAGASAPDTPAAAPGTPPQPSGTGTPAQHTPAPAPGWISVRGTRVVEWLAGGFFSVLLASMVLVPAVSLADTFLDTYGSTVVVVSASALVLSVLVALLVALPRYWTTQGIEVDEHGIAVVQRPMWWFRGRTAAIPWQDIDYIARSAGPGNKLVLEVLLYRVDHDLAMPGWAKLVLAGETKWDRTSSRPRVLFTYGHHVIGRLERMLRSARPDLFEVPAVEPGAPHLRGTAEPQWVSMRGPRLAVWILGAVFVCYTDVALTAMSVVAFAEGDWVDAVGGAVGAVVFLGVTGWVVHVAPRMFTHQGVSADVSGITLVQEPALWFAGRTAHIPWPDVRTISQDVLVTGTGKDRRSSALVHLMLHYPDRVTSAPTWASVAPRELQTPPASPTEPLTRITIKPGNRRHARIVGALRAVRPDFFPGA